MRMTFVKVALQFAALLLAGASAFVETAPLRVDIVDRNIRFVDGAGAPIADGALNDREAIIGDPATGGYRARIVAVVADPFSDGSVRRLYDVRYFHDASGEWRSICAAGPQGLMLAAALPGKWTADGLYQPLSDGAFTFNCSAGAHVKCLRLGYAPWLKDAAGRSLAAKHQACTRMMRADYCGTGRPFTVAGKRIQVLDSNQPSTFRYGRLEAIWDENGARCLAQVRAPEVHPMQEVLEACPRLAAPTTDCTEERFQADPRAVLANRS